MRSAVVCGIITGASPVLVNFPPVLVTVPEVVTKVNSSQFLSHFSSGECRRCCDYNSR